MFEKRIFESEFRIVLKQEMERQGLSVRSLSEKTGIPPITLYKLLSGERDPRLDTVKKIVNVISPQSTKFIAVIGAKFILDGLSGKKVKIGKDNCRIRGYTANSIEDCLVAAVHASNEGAIGIICAPIVSSMVEKVVDVPVVIMKPSASAVNDAINQLKSQLS